MAGEETMCEWCWDDLEAATYPSSIHTKARKAFDEGRKAFADGKPCEDEPGLYARAWREGWHNERKAQAEEKQ